MGDYTLIERIVLKIKAGWCWFWHCDYIDIDLPDIDAGETGPPYYVCKKCKRTWL